MPPRNSGKPLSAHKISEGTLVEHLLFAFLGHRPEAQRDVESLIEIMDALFGYIQSPNSDLTVPTWITIDPVKKSFAGKRKFSQYNEYLRDKSVPYLNTKADQCRNVFAAICSVGRGLFYEGADKPTVIGLQMKLGLLKPDGTFKDLHRAKAQQRVLGQIETELKSVANKPGGAISFDSDRQPVIKIYRAKDFQEAHIADEEIKHVAGRFIVYRKAFMPAEGADYVREYLQISVSRFGLECTWRSCGGPRSGNWTLRGVGFFCDGGFWLMAHSNEHFKRVRMLAANVTEWQRHSEDAVRTPFCTAVLVSHAVVAGEKVATSRSAVLKRDSGDVLSNEDYQYQRLAMPLSRKDLVATLSESELVFIDN